MWVAAVHDLQPAIYSTSRTSRTAIKTIYSSLGLTSPQASTITGALHVRSSSRHVKISLKYIYLAKNAKVEINSKDGVMIYVDTMINPGMLSVGLHPAQRVCSRSPRQTSS